MVILQAFGMAVFAMAVTQFTKRIDRKPFNCELCMTFWLSLLVALLPSHIIMNKFEAVTFIGLSIFWRQLLWRVWKTMF